MDSGVSALKNILYLMADDFRPTLGSYGHPVKTPRLDALAQTALQFDFGAPRLSTA
jgi:arylsulfatase A-like enzyme